MVWRQEWEHMTIDVPYLDIGPRLDELRRDRWRLLAGPTHYREDNPGLQSTHRFVLVFIRERQVR